MKIPTVSVIMPVYNGELYIASAIESILQQSFSNFELIIINDGSDDRSSKIVESYCDPRIIFINCPENLGISAGRNKGLEIVRGKYIALLDCDDISLPTRLEKQVAYLEANLNIGICGTWVKTIGLKEGIWCYPTDPSFLRARMLFDNPLATSSVMIRSASMPRLKQYFDLDCPIAEDYELWERISRYWGVANIPEFLTLYRIHPKQTSIVKLDQQRVSIWKIQSGMLSQLGIVSSAQEKTLHLDIGVGWNFKSDIASLISSEGWIKKIGIANDNTQIFPAMSFRLVLADKLYLAAVSAAQQGFEAWRIYYQSEISKWSNRRYWRLVKLFLLCARGSL